MILLIMTGLVRKELRRIVSELQQLRDSCSSEFEKLEINLALVNLVRADLHDFHLNSRKKCILPKSSFKFKSDG